MSGELDELAAAERADDDGDRIAEVETRHPEVCPARVNAQYADRYGRVCTAHGVRCWKPVGHDGKHQRSLVVDGLYRRECWWDAETTI